MASPNLYGRAELMALAAFRCCFGQRNYTVRYCVDWLVENWDGFTPKTRALIQYELEGAFMCDDEARRNGSDYKPLGMDCDRRQWERVRRLWAVEDLAETPEELGGY